MHRGLRTTTFITLSLIAVAGVVSACAAPAGTTAPAASVQQVAAPTVKFIKPADGSAVTAGDVKIAVETTGLEFVMPSNKVVPGEGHVHFTLDDKPFQMSITPEFVLKSVQAGAHTLKAELVQNDTSSLDPPVLQVIKFTAK